MRKVQCAECGKRYDFDIDDFCPKCGAFNQPVRGSRIAANGQVVRVDGINESNHGGSFVHRELHQEDRVRRRTGLERPKVQAVRRPLGGAGREAYQKAREKKKVPVILWIILAIIAINILSRLSLWLLRW